MHAEAMLDESSDKCNNYCWNPSLRPAAPPPTRQTTDLPPPMRQCVGAPPPPDRADGDRRSGGGGGVIAPAPLPIDSPALSRGHL